jgi:TolA-binding protein
MRAHFALVSVWSSTLILAAPAWGEPVSLSAGASGSTAGASASASVAAPAPPSSGDAAKAASPAAAKPKTGAPSPYGAKIQKGHAAYLAHDLPGAVAAYQEAVQADTADPYGYYFLGEAQLASGNLADASSSFADGIRNAGSRDDIHAKLLFVIADLREREGKWPEAKKAWEEYGQFQSSHPNAKGYAITATERMKMIDTHVDLATKYGAVKQRIEQRVKETTAPAPDDGPQGPTKKK